MIAENFNCWSKGPNGEDRFDNDVFDRLMRRHRDSAMETVGQVVVAMEGMEGLRTLQAIGVSAPKEFPDCE